ncbi:hypothetical protein [Lentimicrobium sp.]
MNRTSVPFALPSSSFRSMISRVIFFFDLWFSAAIRSRVIRVVRDL